MTTSIRKAWVPAALVLTSAVATFLALGTGAIGLWALAGAIDALTLYEISVVVIALWIAGVSVALPDRAFAGESVCIPVEISARAPMGRMGRWRVEIAPEWEGRRATCQGWRMARRVQRPGGCSVELQALGLCRGRHVLRSVRVRLTDAFGLLSVERQLPADGEMVVYPRLVPVEAWVLEIERRMPRLDGARSEAEAVPTGGVVPYRSGERVNLIHWPTSLRRGEIYAKETVSGSPQPWRVVLWLGPGDPPHLAERAISVAASLVAHWQARGEPVECLVPVSGRARVAWRRCRTFQAAARALAEVDGSVGMDAAGPVPRGESRAIIWVVVDRREAARLAMGPRAIVLPVTDHWEPAAGRAATAKRPEP